MACAPFCEREPNERRRFMTRCRIDRSALLFVMGTLGMRMQSKYCSRFSWNVRLSVASASESAAFVIINASIFLPIFFAVA